MELDRKILTLALALVLVSPAAAAPVSVASDPSLANGRIFPPSLATSGVAVPSPAIDSIARTRRDSPVSQSRAHKAQQAYTITRLKPSQ